MGEGKGKKEEKKEKGEGNKKRREEKRVGRGKRKGRRESEKEKRREKKEGKREGREGLSEDYPQCRPNQVLRRGRVSPALPKECAAVVLELKKRPRPRSPNFTTPVAVMNTLAGLMSGRGEEKGEREKSEVEKEIPGSNSLPFLLEKSSCPMGSLIHAQDICRPFLASLSGCPESFIHLSIYYI